MEIGIIGLPRSGKTTVFLALGGQSARDAAARARHGEPIVATIAVPDTRVEKLARIVGSARTAHAMVRYTDLPGLPPEQIERRHGLPDSHLQYLGRVDALLAVIRAFDDGTGVPIEVERDMESLETELVVTDLQRVENRRGRLERTIHRLGGQEREAAQLELVALQKVHEALDDGKPARTVDLDDREEVALRGLALLSRKPIAWLVNWDEKTRSESPDLLERLVQGNLGTHAVCAQIDAEMEKEISEIEEESRAEFFESYGIDEPAASRIVALCFRLLDRIQFFTANEKEAHAWTLRKGATALEAAATVHSDFARGFIKAEVVAWEDLERAGSLAAARKEGSLRAEGKSYIVRDGDVIQFLFHS